MTRRSRGATRTELKKQSMNHQPPMMPTELDHKEVSTEVVAPPEPITMVSSEGAESTEDVGLQEANSEALQEVNTEELQEENSEVPQEENIEELPEANIEALQEAITEELPEAITEAMVLHIADQEADTIT